LAVQLSRDLQQDFYPYFPQIFKSITKLLDTQDTNVLEWSFQTLSYLFKFLWRYMLKDLDNVYELYSPLFSETRKEYIRNFAAESFAFLMRKMNDKNQVYEFLFNRLNQHPEELNGIGRLIFEMFKGIKNQFNACTAQCFTMLLDKLNCFAESSDSNQLVFDCISKTVESMAEYTKKQHTSVVWKSFYATIDKFISNKQNEKLVNLMKLISLFLKLKNCNLVDNLDTLIDNLCKIAALEPFDGKESYSQLTECLMDIGEQLILSETVKFSIEKTNVLPTRLYQPKYDLNLVVKLTKNLFNYNLFEGVSEPFIVRLT
jgi:U3 small nucleolar RNA-associated protein 20